MSDIQFLDNEILINGVSSTKVATTLKESGFKSAAIAEIIGGWFVGVTGAVKPAGFQFDTDVETPNPDCGITYKRSFAHTDWIDGESRVQAGMTPEELGFNARFHSIENEFSAIEAQFTKLGNCVGELRSDLIGVARELEAKITALQNSIHDAKPPPDRGPDILGPIKFGDKIGLVTKFGDDFQVIKYEEMASPIAPRPGVVGPPIDFAPKDLTPGNVLDIVKGIHVTLAQPGGIGDLFAGGKNPTVGDLRSKAPTAVLPGGQALGAVIATMPAETKFTDVNDAVAKITENVMGQLNKTQTKAVKTTVVTGDVSDRTGTALLNSGVVALGVDDTTSTALSAAGLGTISKLSGATVHEIAGALTGAGLDADLANDLLAKATVTKALRNL